MPLVRLPNRHSGTARTAPRCTTRLPQARQPESVRRLLRGRLGGELLLVADDAHHIRGRTISLVAGMLEERPLLLHPRERQFPAPGSRPGLLILDCESIF